MKKLFYRNADLTAMLGISKVTLYHWLAAGEFPKGIKLGKRMVGYPVSIVHEWLEQHGISPESLAAPHE